MTVRIWVIGSSPAWPNPGCAQSGYLVENGDGRLLLDCGPGVLGRLRESHTEVDAVAITHFHLDHCGDLVPWAWLAAYAPELQDRRPELWLPPGGTEELERFSEFWGVPHMWEKAFSAHEYPEGDAFEAAGFRVEAIRVPHYLMQAYAFRVAEDSRTFAYSGDSAPSPELADTARGADLFLCEATLSHGGADAGPRGHLSAEEALEAADGPIVLTHRPIELPPPDGVPLATDGLVLEL